VSTSVEQETKFKEYANPDALVSTQWVAEHIDDPGVRIIEVDVDTTAYDSGHIRNAVGWHWQRDLQHPIIRDIATKEQVEELLSRAGVTEQTTLVFYGDNNNWFAAWAYWLLSYYGFPNLKLMDGGRAKWISEGRELVKEVPQFTRTNIKLGEPRKELRALRDEVAAAIGKVYLVDVRSPREFAGEILAPENLPQEAAQRPGHIPTAKNIPWSQAVREDGTFKSRKELEELYQSQGIKPDKEVIAYCRIGERSAHTWFVLTQLLGYKSVKNYDGSWTEWGSLVNAPIEK
jgi:thiosulfate/3-mercaptopyruvate sulfurtransferase